VRIHATASDARFDDLAMISFVLGTTLMGPVRAVLNAGAACPEAALLRMHVTSMVAAYLYKTAI
jgi:hypothetical protein